MTPAPVQLSTFIHNGSLYTKITPTKKLFNSTLIHEVVNRGDVFALNLSTGIFTVLSRNDYDGAQVVQQSHNLVPSAATLAAENASKAKTRLKELVEQFQLELEKQS